MKNSYHICFTSHDEVMFRDKRDHDMFINLMALRAYSSRAAILADAEMSTHVHLNIVSGEPLEFAARLRMSYTKYFNKKYGRKGRFGQKYTFILSVEGFYHQMVMMNYILRNGLHHGAASNAFGYDYCSARELFRNDIGFSVDSPAIMNRQDILTFIPRHTEFPDHYLMNGDGVFVRNCFMELKLAEQYYSTPRNYLYQMNRLTDESWVQAQQKDQTGEPITLERLEPAGKADVEQMLRNESARSFGKNKWQDLDVCNLIDSDLCKPFGVESAYGLTDSQRQRLARLLANEFHLPQAQICRCLPGTWPR